MELCYCLFKTSVISEINLGQVYIFTKPTAVAYYRSKQRKYSKISASYWRLIIEQVCSSKNVWEQWLSELSHQTKKPCLWFIFCWALKIWKREYTTLCTFCRWFCLPISRLQLA